METFLGNVATTTMTIAYVYYHRARGGSNDGGAIITCTCRVKLSPREVVRVRPSFLRLLLLFHKHACVPANGILAPAREIILRGRSSSSSSSSSLLCRIRRIIYSPPSRARTGRKVRVPLANLWRLSLLPPPPPLFLFSPSFLLSTLPTPVILY